MDPKLIIYCDINSITINELESILISNPLSLKYVFDNKKTDEAMIISLLRKNYFFSVILDDLYKNIKPNNTYLFINKEKLLRNKNINKLIISGLGYYIKDDKYNYIKLSDNAKNNLYLAKLILNVDKRFIYYVGDNINKDKELLKLL